MDENEIVGSYHWLIEHEFEQTLRDSEVQGILEGCSLWGFKESGMTEQLNNNSKIGRWIYRRKNVCVYTCNTQDRTLARKRTEI